jgi:hypothetical protein
MPRQCKKFCKGRLCNLLRISKKQATIKTTVTTQPFKVGELNGVKDESKGSN